MDCRDLESSTFSLTLAFGSHEFAIIESFLTPDARFCMYPKADILKRLIFPYILSKREIQLLCVGP